jgi:hypothetical protein
METMFAKQEEQDERTEERKLGFQKNFVRGN